MDHQEPSSIASHLTGCSAQSKRNAAQKTVAQILSDEKALAEWTTNLEKIRQKESQGVVKHAS